MAGKKIFLEKYLQDGDKKAGFIKRREKPAATGLRGDTGNYFLKGIAIFREVFLGRQNYGHPEGSGWSESGMAEQPTPAALSQMALVSSPLSF